MKFESHPHDAICFNCGKTFHTEARIAKYCGVKCKDEYYKKFPIEIRRLWSTDQHSVTQTVTKVVK